jgi:hypothetical protein
VDGGEAVVHDLGREDCWSWQAQVAVQGAEPFRWAEADFE